jgi:two-component system chemotaxis sensor kinase CheA
MTSPDEALRARLNELFREELSEHLERLEHGLDELAAGLPEVSEDSVAELFRSAHSLKGAAAAVGATAISALCHHLEETLARARDGQVEVDQALVEEMIRLVDQLAAAGERFGTGAPEAEVGVPDTGSDAEPTAAQVQQSGGDPATVRLTSGRLDALLSQAGDLITATYRSELLVSSWRNAGEDLAVEAEQWRRDRDVLHRALGRTGTEDPQVREALERIDNRTRRTAAELNRLARSTGTHEATLRGMATSFAESVRQVRMVPFTEATTGLARMVRDLAGEQGKQARLVVDAADAEVDKQLVATLHDVLGHAVRNAVAHGIEPPEQRSAAGKPETGAVVVRAVLRTNGIAVTVTDDGRGIDVARVRDRLEALGLGPGGGKELSLTEALFHPGLSTAQKVTEVSGRGVGLDAVRAAVDATGGSVSFDSEPGQGARLTISVPLTLSSLRVVLVRVAGEVVAVPTSAVLRLVRATTEGIRLGGRQVWEVEESVVPVVPLAQVLGWGEPDAPADPTGLLVTGPEGSVALLAEELVAEREVVLVRAPARLAGMNMLLGTTQLEDGSVALVLSPSVCARVALAGTTPEPEHVGPKAETSARVLLVEDTVTTRELERSILVSAGYDVAVAVDGQQAWEMLQARDFDAVVSDVNMPRMDGIALCRAIRGSRRHPNLPVVLVTSLHSDADRRRGLEAGADAYLDKSGFDRAELLATLERVL